MRQLLHRAVALFRARKLDPQLDDEVQFHLEMLVDDYIRRGMSDTDARAAARRSFGGVTQMKEEYRDQRGLPFVETTISDLRYGVRTLLRTPGFTLAALITLALGIGANSAIFSVVNAVLLQPLPYEESERIVQMHRSAGGLWSGQTGARYLFHRDHLTTVAPLAAWRGTFYNLVAGDQAEQVPTLAVSKEYFTVFSGRPLHGRTFDALEDSINGPDAVVLGYGIWRRLFRGDPAVVGTAITLGDRPFTVVGIMPQGFDSIRTSELYVPLEPSTTGPGGGANYTVAGRLRPGATLAQANAELESLFESYKASVPGEKWDNNNRLVFVSYQEGLSRESRPALVMMLGAVGLLLLIACANTASLLLARASGRGREIAVRAALGAGRARIVRQLLTESVVLFVAGGFAGVALAYWTLPMLLQLMPPGYLPHDRIRVDGAVLGVSLLVSAVTGALFGLVPALGASRLDLVASFKDGARTTGGVRSIWARRTLVVAEVALCMILLVGAGLLVQTFVSLRTLDTGFDPDNLLTVRMSLRGGQFESSAATDQLYELGLERLRRLPGVVSAAAVNGIPIERGLNLNIDRLDTPEEEFGLTDWRYATPDYFDTLGIQVVRGRGLDARDTASSPRVAVVSEQFVRVHYKDVDPIGQRFTVFKADGPIEIVGVARDLREGGLTGRPIALMYVPVAQASDSGVAVTHGYFPVSWVIRTSGASPELQARVREELRAIAPRQPITAIRTMDEIKAAAMARQTFQMTLASAFATIGLLLGAAGIYGLIAYSVAQRTREFGIRMALGATRGGVIGLVLRQGVLLAGVGVVIGALGAVLLTRSLESFLFGVSALDAATFVSVGLLLVLTAVSASFVPALRAVRLNPVSALRE